QDQTFLDRLFPEASEGTLWDAGKEIQINQHADSSARRTALFAVKTVADMATLADVPASIRQWAAEAVMPDSDGYYGTGHNFFLYDHPTRGFIWLSHDLDASFDVYGPTVDPIYWLRSDQPERNYLVVMHERPHREEYLAALEQALAAYDVGRLLQWQSDWVAQIDGAVADDPTKATTVEAFRDEAAELRTYIAERATFMRGWLDCRATGQGTDADGDGVPFCLDCADTDAAVNPGAAETCGNKL